MMKKIRNILVLLLAFSTTQGQKLKKADKQIIHNLESHIHFLADDKLEGRRAGSPGEALAAAYISKQFQAAGLIPNGDNHSWLQAFPIHDGKEIKAATSFSINGTPLKLQTDFLPLAWSANGHLEANPAISLPEHGMPWFVDIKDWLDENEGNPHFDLDEKFIEHAATIAKKGAAALILYNTSGKNDGVNFDAKSKLPVASIPVIYLKESAAKKYLSDASATLATRLNIDIGEKLRTGHNVIGLINNGAPQTIILGAHFDHLGYGEDGNSMLRNDFTQIHNGADDNASGTAALIELAKMLKASKFKSNNYLFVAFSGEELGLFGSKYFTDHPSVDLSSVNYMINMDMVGRLNDSGRVLTIGGAGTSPVWISNISSIPNKYFQVKFDSSGTGPSDHTSFYRKNIPVLFFFTGTHKDYHRPSDDADKINYTGEYMVCRFIYNIIEKENAQGRLVFTPTRETQSSSPSRLSVTMGIMPDYTYNGAGIRVDGVSENRPAQKAGIKTGDIITQLGEHSVTSMETYMKALNAFKKGDTTKVKFTRGVEVMEANVQF